MTAELERRDAPAGCAGIDPLAQTTRLPAKQQGGLYSVRSTILAAVLSPPVTAAGRMDGAAAAASKAGRCGDATVAASGKRAVPPSTPGVGSSRLVCTPVMGAPAGPFRAPQTRPRFHRLSGQSAGFSAAVSQERHTGEYSAASPHDQEVAEQAEADPATPPAPEDTAGAGLTVSEGSGCVVTPSLRKLQAMSAEQLRRVEGFSIRIPGEAAVTFLEAVDLSEIRVPLDHVVSIDVVEKTVDFYPDLYFPTPASKPVPGEGLNVKVEIRMANMPDDVTLEDVEVCTQRFDR